MYFQLVIQLASFTVALSVLFWSGLSGFSDSSCFRDPGTGLSMDILLSAVPWILDLLYPNWRLHFLSVYACIFHSIFSFSYVLSSHYLCNNQYHRPNSEWFGDKQIVLLPYAWNDYYSDTCSDKVFPDNSSMSRHFCHSKFLSSFPSDRNLCWTANVFVMTVVRVSMVSKFLKEIYWLTCMHFP